MDSQEHHLILLMEECAEAAHRALKQLRFGRNEVQPGQDRPNHVRLREEIMDVMVAVRILEGTRQIEPIHPLDVTIHYELKLEKITRMQNLARSQGRLSDG